MSRKAAYGYDYDDLYDDYEDYEDYECYDDGYGENGEAVAVNEEITKVKPGLWRCSICTYDNDDSMSYCDICGVLRYPPSNTGKNMEQKTVGGVCKDSGVSRLAKSLFASPPRRTPNIAVVPLPQSFTDDIGGGNNFLDSASRSRCCTSIAPFKFDIPSPDDVISNRLHSTKITPRGRLYDCKRLLAVR